MRDTGRGEGHHSPHTVPEDAWGGGMMLLTTPTRKLFRHTGDGDERGPPCSRPVALVSPGVLLGVLVSQRGTTPPNLPLLLNPDARERGGAAPAVVTRYTCVSTLQAEHGQPWIFPIMVAFMAKQTTALFFRH